MKYKPYFFVFRSLYGIGKSLNRYIFYKKKSETGKILPSISGFQHSFCGYYDHSPFASYNSDFILVHSTNANLLRNPSSKYIMQISIQNHKTGDVELILGNTRAWNWQQGARALWISENQWAYNNFCYQSKKYYMVTGFMQNAEKYTLPWPIQEFSSKGVCFSIDYEVLSQLRPDYGYFCHFSKQNILTNKIIAFSSKTGEILWTLPIYELKIKKESILSKYISKFKFNHLLCNPDGNFLIFMFRYFVDERKFTDIMLLDIATKEYKLIYSSSDISHYCWMDNHNILFTGSYQERYGYFLINIHTQVIQLIYLTSDGHPTRVTNNIFLRDTYANQYGVRSLFQQTLDGDENATNLLAQFIEPWYLWGQRRCDLHPSISKDNQYWQVDCVISGCRRISIGSLK